MAKKYIVLCFVLLSACTVFSQNSSHSSEDLAKIKAVYGNYTSKMDAAQLEWLYTKLSRSAVIQAPRTTNESYPKLSGLKVVNKYVPDLKMETSFDPSHINPLKYYINYYQKTDQTFRIDGTYFVLLIKKME
jgi:hypothetical protein